MDSEFCKHRLTDSELYKYCLTVSIFGLNNIYLIMNIHI